VGVKGLSATVDPLQHFAVTLTSSANTNADIVDRGAVNLVNDPRLAVLEQRVSQYDERPRVATL